MDATRLKLRLAATVTAAVLAGAFLTALALSQPAQRPSGDGELAEPLAFPADEPLPPEEREGFWVCASGGVITVYHNTDREVPVKTTRTEIKTLRRADQELLQGGVFFVNYLDAMSFLENFAP
ncbi:MAG: hypothetical protein LBR72_06925 [Oscillospiraceae bacterium]|jgi:hypothetical protein|nr:hypothetical protein [Oscillospiraceae bacterium]